MAEIVGLNGQKVDAEIPREDRPEDVLQTLLTEIRDGTVQVTRLIVIVEGSAGDSDNTYFTRTSLATRAEAISLTAIGQRLVIDNIFDV